MFHTAADINEAATLAADELLGGGFDEFALLRIAAMRWRE
jgi:hypothetical protein